MKLYTEEQLFDICQSVAEKMCANSLPKEVIINKCRHYGNSKIEIDNESINGVINNIDDDTIHQVVFKTNTEEANMKPIVTSSAARGMSIELKARMKLGQPINDYIGGFNEAIEYAVSLVEKYEKGKGLFQS